MRGLRRGLVIGVWVLCAGGCEKLVGIHTSVMGDAGAPTDVGGSEGTDAGRPTDSLAGDHDATDGPFTLDSGDDRPSGLDGAGGADADAGTDGSAGDTSSDLVVDRPPDAPTDKVVDSGTDTMGDGRVDGAPSCGADPTVATPLAGTAYRYTGGPNGGDVNGKGMCGFPNSQLSKAIHYGAIDSGLFAKATRCGACMRVVAGSAQVDVQIIDVMQPLTGAHGWTISVDAGAQTILSAAGGNPDVQFSFVPCSTTGTISVVFTAPLDPSVLVMNHRNQLQSVQLVTTTRTLDMTRQNYNTWTPPTGYTFGGGTVILALTDVFGNSVRTSNLDVSATFKDTNQQFPLCPR